MFAGRLTMILGICKFYKLFLAGKGQKILEIYFFICAPLELFCDFLQFDWLHERTAFYDILARGPKELFF